MQAGRLPRRAGVRRRLWSASLAAALAALPVVAGATPAAAHAVGSSAPASNYRTVVRGLEPAVAGLTVEVVEAGDKLALTNRTGEEVLVLGTSLEPYLRVGPGGVFENELSPSSPRAGTTADPSAAPRWRRVGDGPTAVWHEHRSHWEAQQDAPEVRQAPGEEHVVMPDWQVPLRVGDRTVVVHGTVTWVPPPSPWPWVALAVALAAATIAAARRWGSAPLLALVVAVAVTADLVHTGGSWAESTASAPAKLYGIVVSAAGWLLGALAIARLLRRGTDAAAIPLLLSGVFLAFASALPDLTALARSQLPSALPPPLVRATIATVLGLGAAMILTGILALRAGTRPATNRVGDR